MKKIKIEIILLQMIIISFVVSLVLFIAPIEIFEEYASGYYTIEFSPAMWENSFLFLKISLFLIIAYILYVQRMWIKNLFTFLYLKIKLYHLDSIQAYPSEIDKTKEEIDLVKTLLKF